MTGIAWGFHFPCIPAMLTRVLRSGENRDWFSRPMNSERLRGTPVRKNTLLQRCINPIGRFILRFYAVWYRLALTARLR